MDAKRPSALDPALPERPVGGRVSSIQKRNVKLPPLPAMALSKTTS